jgi:hypothetical protein
MGNPSRNGPITIELLIAALALGMPLAGIAGCGDASDAPQSVSAAASGRALQSDGDYDNPKDIDGDEVNDHDEEDDSRTRESYDYHDKDDSAILSFGRAAGPGEAQGLTSAAERYLAVAASGDGGGACALMAPALAKSVPQDYGRGASPAYLRSDTCAGVMSRLFEHEHCRLTAQQAITGVRLGAVQALVLLGSKTAPASYLTFERSAGSWRMTALFAAVLP